MLHCFNESLNSSLTGEGQFQAVRGYYDPHVGFAVYTIAERIADRKILTKEIVGHIDLD